MTTKELQQNKKALLKRKSLTLTNILVNKHRNSSKNSLKLLEGFKNDLNRDIKLYKNV